MEKQNTKNSLTVGDICPPQRHRRLNSAFLQGEKLLVRHKRGI
ncbi:hypothetical protein [Shinella zoogloeoides]|nr:hypothetical protein [Shinella zoogloeoides]